MKKLVLISLAFLISACGRTSFTSQELEKAEIQRKELEQLSQSVCQIPWARDGRTIEAGQRIAAYKQSSTCSNDCSENMIYRECKDGVLTGPNEYRFASCQTNVCRSCETPWGSTLNHGEQVQAYKQAQAACHSGSDNQLINCEDPSNIGTLTCSDGELLGADQYSSPTCRQSRCGCPVPWEPSRVIPDGGNLLAYKSSTGPCDEPVAGVPGHDAGDIATCDSLHRLNLQCSDGAFLANGRVWSSDELYQTCTPRDCHECYAGSQGLIPHGQETNTIFQFDLRTQRDADGSLQCDLSCDRVRGSAVCVDGSWYARGPATPDNYDPAYWTGFLDEPDPVFSCAYPNTGCKCEKPWAPGEVMEHGESELAFPFAASPTCDDICEPYQESIRCEFGQLIFGDGVGPDGYSPQDFAFLNCANPDENPACYCLDPFSPGRIVLHGDPLSAFTAPAPACQAACSSVAVGGGDLLCQNGQFEDLSGDIVSDFSDLYSSCDPDAADCSCPNPINAGEPIANGESITLWAEASVACAYRGNTCEAATQEDPESGCRSQVFSCQNGQLRDANGNSPSSFSANPASQCRVDCQFCDMSSFNSLNQCIWDLDGTHTGDAQVGPLIQKKDGPNNNCKVQLSTGAARNYLACGESCSNETATVVCQRNDVTGLGELIIDPAAPNPANLTLGDLEVPATCCAVLGNDSQTAGLCSSGGNPTRACPLPGDFDLFQQTVPTVETADGHMYRSRQERPPHTRFPNVFRSGESAHYLDTGGETPRAGSYWDSNYLPHYTLFKGTPQEESFPYGFRYYWSPNPNDPDEPGTIHYTWFNQVSPQTVMTFYRRSEVTPTVDDPRTCDDFARVMRCNPDGYWYPVDEPNPSGQNAVGPPLAGNFQKFKYTSCQTRQAGYSWAADASMVQLLDGCLNLSASGTCIFDKNPFHANEEQPVAPQNDALHEALQSLSIAWSDPSLSGLLQSESFRILELFTYDMTLGQRFVITYNDDGSSTVEDVEDSYCRLYSAEVLTDSFQQNTDTPKLSEDHLIGYSEKLRTQPPSDSGMFETRGDYPALRSQLFFGLEWIKESLINRFGPDMIHFQDRSMNVIQGDPLFKNNAAFVRAYDPFLVFGHESDFLRDANGFIIANPRLTEVFGRPYSVDLSVIAHELAHSNFYFINGIDNTELGSRGQPGVTVDCSQGSTALTLCCSDQRGCIRAIDEGQADFFTNILFNSEASDTNAAVGDGIQNSLDGVTACGISRNAKKNSIDRRLTASQAFQSCARDNNNNPPQYNFRGQIHVMGSVYSAAWWNIRNNQSSDARRHDIELLFLEHLKFLDSTSDFCDSIVAAQEAESSLISQGKLSGPGYASQFSDEMLYNRGLIDYCSP